MRKLSTLAVLLAACIGMSAQEKVTFMPAWTPQAQFAGFYVALEKGFYAAEGLDVTIEHMGINSSIPGIVRIKEGEVDIIESHPIQSLLAREEGLKIVNVFQVTQNTGIMIASHKPVPDIKSLEGMKIGRWKSGFSEICEICLASNHVNVEWVPFLSGINLYISKAVDATVVMSYNELNSVFEAVGTLPEDHLVKFSDYGYNIPEDGLYVTEDYLAKHADIVAKFCEATRKGWLWCRDNREEALDIVMDYVEKTGVRTSRYHQQEMLKGMLDLTVNPDSGNMDFQQIPEDRYNSLMDILVKMNYLSNPIPYKEFIR